MVAVAYTKADEFGTMDPDLTRLFPENVQGALSTGRIDKSLQQVSQETRAVNGPVQRGKQKVGGAVFSGPGRVEKKTDKPWDATRQKVVANTEGLWLEIQKAGKVPGFINGYFLAADPLEPYLERWSARGFHTLFGDFFRYFLGGK
jgi:hypothetical protein